jgi:hypothetical protein
MDAKERILNEIRNGRNQGEAALIVLATLAYDFLVELKKLNQTCEELVKSLKPCSKFADL